MEGSFRFDRQVVLALPAVTFIGIRVQKGQSKDDSQFTGLQSIFASGSRDWLLAADRREEAFDGSTT